MILLTFKTKEEALGFYPGLADYLSQFKSPQVALLGASCEDATYENLVVEHETKGPHSIISVPKMGNVLRYDHLKELYRSDKKYDTHICTELPYGYEVNYETFLVMEGLGRAATVTEQPEWGDTSNVPTFDIDYHYITARNVDPTLKINDLSLNYNAEDDTFYCTIPEIIPMLEGMEMGVYYQGCYREHSPEMLTNILVSLVDIFIDPTYGKSLRIQWIENADHLLGIFQDGKFILKSISVNP